jgi:hypothetical protein
MSKYFFTIWLSSFSFISVAQIIQDISISSGTLNAPSSIQSTNDNGFIVAGNNCLGLFVPPLFSTTIIKLDSSLNTMWTITQPPRYAPNITNSYISADGSYLVNDSEDVLNSSASLSYRQSKILKVKPNGVIDWVYTFDFPFQNTPGSITEFNNEIYMLWHCYTEDYNNLNANSEWHIVKFSSSGDSLGSINISNLSPPGMFFKGYNDLIATSDGKLILTGWGQTWLPSLLSNSFNQAVTVPLVQKIDFFGNLLWDYTEQLTYKQTTYQAQFARVKELPCGDIITFGFDFRSQVNGYSIRFDSNGQLIKKYNQNQAQTEFLSGAPYHDCGFLAVGSIVQEKVPLIISSFIVGNNNLHQEVINTSITNYPQETAEIVYDICPLKNDPNKFALVMRNSNASRVVIIGDFQNELTVPETPEQGILLEVKASGLCRSDWHAWMGHDLEEMIQTSPNKTGYFAFEIPKFIKDTDQLTINLWNRSGTPILIKRFEIYHTENWWN